MNESLNLINFHVLFWPSTYSNFLRERQIPPELQQLSCFAIMRLNACAITFDTVPIHYIIVIII